MSSQNIGFTSDWRDSIALPTTYQACLHKKLQRRSIGGNKPQSQYYIVVVMSYATVSHFDVASKNNCAPPELRSTKYTIGTHVEAPNVELSYGKVPSPKLPICSSLK